MHLRSFQARALYVGALRGESVTKKGVPLAPRGVPWAAQGHILGFEPKMDLQFRANGSHVCNLSTKVGLAELIPGSTGSTGSSVRSYRLGAP